MTKRTYDTVMKRAAQLEAAVMERDGKIVAHLECVSFTGPDLNRLATERKCYVVTFFGQDCNNPETFYAVDDSTAKEFAAAKWHGPYQVTERITTWRVVQP